MMQLAASKPSNPLLNNDFAGSKARQKVQTGSDPFSDGSGRSAAPHTAMNQDHMDREVNRHCLLEATPCY